MNSQQPELVWLHEESASPTDPALLAYPHAPAVWVWDDNLLREDRYSLKRIAFLYECVVETRASIWRGETVSTLLQQAQTHGAATIVVTESLNPRFAALVASLRQHLPVEIVEADAFVPLHFDADLRRFSRFWRKAEPYAFGTRRG